MDTVSTRDSDVLFGGIVNERLTMTSFGVKRPGNGRQHIPSCATLRGFGGWLQGGRGI